MGKRTDFPRRKNDAYDTPLHAAQPLFKFLSRGSTFIEPCAGNGMLARHLMGAGLVCHRAFDIKPRSEFVFDEDRWPNPRIERRNALTYRMFKEGHKADYFITNPPWTFELLAPLILQLWWQLPTWMLLAADFAHNEDSSTFMAMCREVVSVGRVRWMEGQAEDKGHAPYDNAAWYLFDAQGAGPRFHGRQ